MIIVAKSLQYDKIKENKIMSEENLTFITASEMAEILGVSVGHAYKVIRKMNNELKKSGFLVISGKVPRVYFEKRWFGI